MPCTSVPFTSVLMLFFIPSKPLLPLLARSSSSHGHCEASVRQKHPCPSSLLPKCILHVLCWDTSPFLCYSALHGNPWLPGVRASWRPFPRLTTGPKEGLHHLLDFSKCISGMRDQPHNTLLSSWIIIKDWAQSMARKEAVLGCSRLWICSTKV